MFYIQKIEGDYNNKLISLAELTTQRTNYGNASKEEKEAMDSEAEQKAVSNSNSSLSVEGDIHSQLKRIESTVDSNNRILNLFLILWVIGIVCSIGLYIAAIS